MLRLDNLAPAQKGDFMPDSENGVLLYSEDGTPYFIPTDRLAQFEVTGDSLSALQEAASGGEPAESSTVVTAFQVEDVGPVNAPDWPIGCRPS